MSVGTDLLKLQEIDLALIRNRQTLENMPGVAELAKKRSTYKKLQRDTQKLFAQRKDAQIDVDDFDEKLEITRNAAAKCRDAAKDLDDSREIRAAEIELSDYAKRIEKISRLRDAAASRLDDFANKEAYLKDYTSRFGASIIEDAGVIKENATKLTQEISELEDSRQRLRSRMDASAVATYDKTRTELGTIAVESLKANKPSVCRITLSPSSMADVKDSDVTLCPYCHRILVIDTHDEEETSKEM